MNATPTRKLHGIERCATRVEQSADVWLEEIRSAGLAVCASEEQEGLAKSAATACAQLALMAAAVIKVFVREAREFGDCNPESMQKRTFDAEAVRVYARAAAHLAASTTGLYCNVVRATRADDVNYFLEDIAHIEYELGEMQASLFNFMRTHGFPIPPKQE